MKGERQGESVDIFLETSKGSQILGFSVFAALDPVVTTSICKI